MEIDSSNQEKSTGSGGGIKAIPRKFKAKVVEIVVKTKKIGQDDPRRVAHSAKVGLALTLVSFLYYFRPLYDGFGQAGMWAILTVVVVFEYTVGKSCNKRVHGQHISAYICYLAYIKEILNTYHHFYPYNNLNKLNEWIFFSLGGTLSKCINRGFATLLAGALGIAAEYLATLCGENGEPVLLGILVFILGKNFINNLPMHENFKKPIVFVSSTLQTLCKP